MKSEIVLPEGQDLIDFIQKYCRKLSFEWSEITKEYVEIKENTKIYDWLNSIRFNTIYAFIIEVLQNYINFIISNRERTFEVLCKDMKLDLQNFYQKIEEIQMILIKNNKVKICNDGKVVIMNDVY